jgi:thymidylate synthase (FAD)
MKLVDQSVEFIPQLPGKEGIMKKIEICARTCYKSTSKGDDSAEKMVNALINSQHYAMLEHAAVYLTMDLNNDRFSDLVKNAADFFERNPYSLIGNREGIFYVTTNYRVVIENKDVVISGIPLIDIVDMFMTEPTDYHERRISLRFITSIGVTREMNRHRKDSIAEQSTRYCNYSKDKFGNEITFVKPVWCPDYDETDWDRFLKSLSDAENAYMKLIDQGWKPQQAREVLPLCTATEIIHTAFQSDWEHFFRLRLDEVTGPVHPNMKDVATKAMKVMNDNGYFLGWFDEINDE